MFYFSYHVDHYLFHFFTSLCPSIASFLTTWTTSVLGQNQHFFFIVKCLKNGTGYLGLKHGVLTLEVNTYVMYFILLFIFYSCYILLKYLEHKEHGRYLLRGGKIRHGEREKKKNSNAFYGHGTHKGTTERNDKIYCARVTVICLKHFHSKTVFSNIFKFLFLSRRQSNNEIPFPLIWIYYSHENNVSLKWRPYLTLTY